MVNNWGKNVNCILGDEVRPCKYVQWSDSPVSYIHACQCCLVPLASKAFAAAVQQTTAGSIVSELG